MKNGLSLAELKKIIKSFEEEMSKHEYSLCSVCSHTILADTEEWEFPLCISCYEDLGSPEREPKFNYFWILVFLI